MEWSQLCDLVMEKFDKNQYQILLRQFDALKQKGSVLEYQTAFEKITQGLLLYNDGYDDTYFMNRLVARLKEKIHFVIALHRAKDVDTASALALIQEEELAQSRTHYGPKEFARGAWRVGADKPRGGEMDKGKQDVQKLESKDKLSALKEFRRKNGLCFKCGNKWALGQKCPQQVPLHVIEEIFDALEVMDDSKTSNVAE